MYSKALNNSLLMDWHHKHTYAHTQNNRTKVVFIEASSPDGKDSLKTRFCLGPVHLVWCSRFVGPGTSERRAEPTHRRAAISLLSSARCSSWQSKPLLRIPPRDGAHPCSSGGGWCLKSKLLNIRRRRRRRRRKKTLADALRRPLRGFSVPFYPLRHAHSGVIRSQAWLTQAWIILGRGSSGVIHTQVGLDLFPSWRPPPPSESVGGAMTFPLVSARRMPGAEGFSSLFYSGCSGPQLLF